MEHLSFRELNHFRNDVGIKFQLYNSLFTSLPFHRIEKTGILLSLFLNHCEESFRKRMSPGEVVEQFFQKYTSLQQHKEQVDLLFRFVQYCERQVVLFDAVEDAAFTEINDTGGVGTLKHMQNTVLELKKQKDLLEKLKTFSVTLVLTAHPTQFYPGSVLGIINDLSRALKEDNAAQINKYLQQLGKTPLFKKQKPTPYDEAVSLIWYLENVFYNAIGSILVDLKEHFPEIDLEENPVIQMGFWPGGDRDGNPNVTADITFKVAEALRSSIIKCYYLDIRRLKRRLTFKGVDTILADLETKLYQNIFVPGAKTELTRHELLDPLLSIRQTLIYEHNGLFLQLLESLIQKIHVFGLHFASLDVRQESTAHGKLYEEVAVKENILPANFAVLTDEEKIRAICSISKEADPERYDGISRDTLLSIDSIEHIQRFNGEQGCNRYIISQCGSVLNVLEVYGLFLLRGWKKEELNIDIVPLFETIEDLKNAPAVMKALYENKEYAEHLARRNKLQTIMVGFSDGTKDGGYLMANWSIFKAKEELTRISKQYGIDVVFFDGRGGPPARGGGKTHKFYASMGKNISTREIQLTIQGQTVSSNFGNKASARYNIEQLLNAGIANELFAENDKTLNAEQEKMLQQLADISFDTYKKLKEHPDFLNYLSEVSPLNYYSETNISSRPSKRGKSSRLSLKDLRAIPFVGAWSQLKQNVPGYFGLGTALEALDRMGKLNEIKHLYQRSLYFKTLMDNCEMAMKKSYFPLTSYLAGDPQYGELWNLIVEEYERTQKYLFRLSDKTELMSDYPVEQLSIQMRERIVLPLTTIQQYALIRLRQENHLQDVDKETLEKLIVRTAFGIINAGRNSV
ncbi:MAG TPA: phosphoenolpyruvate carboxylase [Flavisolibacter sp.]|jgi:phosphoenolpyruvate carboxylase|nr:phosphoenolpyruvate carboxylase [Flavisolibacter sp.]